MINFNTNISSIIARQNLALSTKLLNSAVEQMSTGYKINHAKDNAAGYSISTNMTTRIGAYQVAESNVSMGLDMLTTANDSLSQIEDKLIRLRALQTQATNGTYGDKSLQAINSEANAIVAEIERLYSTTSYNGIDIFTNNSGIAKVANRMMARTMSLASEPAAVSAVPDGMPVANPDTGFIAEVVQDTPEIVVTDPTKLAEAIANNTIIGISNAETLAELATLVNSGTSCSGKTIVLTSDIDLSEYSTGEGWTPIGNSSNPFDGSFNGNGYAISNLYINRPDADYQGLFGYITYTSSYLRIRSLGLENVNVVGGSMTGALVGEIKYNGNMIINCYATGNVTGVTQTGGLVGYTNACQISSSYTICNVIGTGNCTGGLVGDAETQSPEHCYAIGDVTGVDDVGGLLGRGGSTDCYATGDVTGVNYVGGLIGYSRKSTENSSSTGNVTGEMYVGGLMGMGFILKECYSTGNVVANSYVGGLFGTGFASNKVNDSYATGDVTGVDYVGGLAGYLTQTEIIDSYTTSKVITSGSNVGAVVGNINNKYYYGYSATFSNCIYYSEINPTLSPVGTINGSMTGTFTDEISPPPPPPPPFEGIVFQVGVSGASTSEIKLVTKFWLNGLDMLRDIGLDTATDYLSTIDELIATVSAKQTEYGSVSNRLMSVLEEIAVQQDNLVSSRSTLRDADIAKVSSQYIQQQILQEAAMTLLATANQTPSIALGLI